jgi:hypothetical protein
MHGVVFLAIAGAQVLVALMIFARNPLGAAFGIFLAMLNGSIALPTIANHVGWSLAVMAIDLLAIFGLWAYGMQRPARRAAARRAATSRTGCAVEALWKLGRHDGWPPTSCSGPLVSLRVPCRRSP